MKLTSLPGLTVFGGLLGMAGGFISNSNVSEPGPYIGTNLPAIPQASASNDRRNPSVILGKAESFKDFLLERKKAGFAGYPLHKLEESLSGCAAKEIFGIAENLKSDLPAHSDQLFLLAMKKACGEDRQRSMGEESTVIKLLASPVLPAYLDKRLAKALAEANGPPVAEIISKISNQTKQLSPFLEMYLDATFKQAKDSAGVAAAIESLRTIPSQFSDRKVLLEKALESMLLKPELEVDEKITLFLGGVWGDPAKCSESFLEVLANGEVSDTNVIAPIVFALNSKPLSRTARQELFNATTNSLSPQMLRDLAGISSDPHLRRDLYISATKRQIYADVMQVGAVDEVEGATSIERQNQEAISIRSELFRLDSVKDMLTRAKAEAGLWQEVLDRNPYLAFMTVRPEADKPYPRPFVSALSDNEFSPDYLKWLRTTDPLAADKLENQIKQYREK